MSTKIYDAYKVIKGKLETVFEIKRDMDNLYEQHVITTMKNLLKNCPTLTVDEFLKCRSKNVRPRVLPYLKDKQLIELDSYDLEAVIGEIIHYGVNDVFNFSMSMVVYSYKNKIFIQFFGLDDKKYYEYLRKKENDGILVDFYYQNQTDDTPEDVSQLVFRRRGEIWDKIYEENSSCVPNQIGFSYDFWNRGHIILRKLKETQ